MSGAVILARLNTIEEALVVQSLLKANDIDTALDNGYHAQNDWLMVPALGGFGVLVSPSDRDRARNLLIHAIDQATENLGHRWGDLHEQTRDRRIVRKWSFPVLYLIHPIAILLYLAIAGFLTFLENRRRRDSSLL